jgi:sterol desaturase/sphingolipid hydroxylase (fatty acid hydroxylase superfamily)
MFNHANVKLPLAVDKVLRFILVTPDMHRVHHSTIGRETNSNFGFNITWWDKIFGSYQDQPKLGHDNMNIGVKGYDDIKQTQYLPFMLWLPFSKKKKQNEKEKITSA